MDTRRTYRTCRLRQRLHGDEQEHTAERQLMFSARLIFNWSFLMYRWYSAMPCTAEYEEEVGA